MEGIFHFNGLVVHRPAEERWHRLYEFKMAVAWAKSTENKFSLMFQMTHLAKVWETDIEIDLVVYTLGAEFALFLRQNLQSEIPRSTVRRRFEVTIFMDRTVFI